MIKEKENSLLVPSIRLVNPGHLSRVDQLRAAVQDIISLQGTGNQARSTALITLSLHDGEKQLFSKILALLQLSKQPHLISDQKLGLGDNSERRGINEGGGDA